MKGAKAIGRLAKEATKATEGVIILRKVDRQLREDFKVLCIRRGTNMREALTGYMAEQVRKATQ